MFFCRTFSLYCLALLLLGLAASGRGWALDVDRLWLPKQHLSHYFKLQDAARVAEALEECVEVLRGTLDLDMSREQQPYYRILCRRSDGVSYTEMIDGRTLSPVSGQADPPPETPRERDQRLAREALEAEQARLQELEQQKARAAKAEQEAAERERQEAERRRKEAERLRQEEEQRRQKAEKQRRAEEEAQRLAERERRAAEQAKAEARRQARKQAEAEERRQQAFAEICRAEVLARTARMVNVRWLTGQLVPERLDNGQMRFYGDFDARNPWGGELQYQAVCIISTPDEFIVQLRKR